MAQHRTKEDKQNAQQHRLESSKLYSLTAIEKTSPEVSKKSSTVFISQKTGIDLRYVKMDLLRTAFSTIVVVVLLAAGTYYLG